MKIDGRAIALEMYTNLKSRVGELKKNSGVQPHMALILVGDNPSTLSYIRQKQKWSDYIGTTVSIFYYPLSVKPEVIKEKIHRLNDDKTIHGIIIQQPLPSQLNTHTLSQLVTPKKDIDGFTNDSPFEVPVAQAVFHVLEIILKSKDIPKQLGEMKIVILGKGPTAGAPINNLFHFP